MELAAGAQLARNRRVGPFSWTTAFWSPARVPEASPPGKGANTAIAGAALAPFFASHCSAPVEPQPMELLSGGDQVLRTSTLIQDRPDRGEEQGNLPGESDGSSPTPLRDSSWYDGDAKK